MYRLPNWSSIKSKVADDDAKKILQNAASKMEENAKKSVGGGATDEPSLKLASETSPKATETSPVKRKRFEMSEAVAEEFKLGWKDAPAVLVEAAKLQKENLTANNPGRLLTPTEVRFSFIKGLFNHICFTFFSIASLASTEEKKTKSYPPS